MQAPANYANPPNGKDPKGMSALSGNDSGGSNHETHEMNTLRTKTSSDLSHHTVSLCWFLAQATALLNFVFLVCFVVTF